MGMANGRAANGRTASGRAAHGHPANERAATEPAVNVPAVNVWAVNEQGVNGRGEPLSIAMVVPPWYEVPPAGYGGLERVCASLIDGLVARGHRVALFGTGTRTGTRARFISTHPQLQYPRLLESLPELVHITRVNDLLEAGAFDLVHDHTTVGPVTANQRRIPTAVTVHSDPSGELGCYLAQVDAHVSLVAISAAQRRLAPRLNWVGTIHHGIEANGPTKARPGDGPVLWLGRFDPEKGPDLAIEATRKAGLPLVLAGKCNQRDEWQYLDEVIRPMLGPDVELVLNAPRRRTDDLLGRARALLLPIRWEEPFGMVMIEAMARGTPVVALNRGAAAEVVAHGRTGFICANEADLAEALIEAPLLDSAACVEHVRTHFSVELMAQRYEALYRTILAPTREAAGLSTLISAPTRPDPVG